ncbi:sigpep_I_arch, signal peptidase I [Candidatus Nanopelagicaceae bacterium]
MKTIQEIFPETQGNQIWVESEDNSSTANILLTITSTDGEMSAFISNGNVVELNQSLLVEPSVAPVNQIKVKRFEALGKALTFSGYFVAILLLLFSAFSFTGAVKARIVLTGSMAPAINTGDVILTTPVNRKEPKVGDVIAYQAKRFNGQSVAVFSHRIIGGDIDSGFIVKGDSNKSPDTQKPKRGDILGVVIFVIPYIGNLLTPKALFLLVPCLFGFWLILDAMKNVE